MEIIKYTDLKPGDTIAWKFEIEGDKVTKLGVVKCFHASFINPIGFIETMDGKMISKEKIDYKIVSDRKIYIDK
jgi:hypothetical protein